MALGDGLSLIFRIKADADQARREVSSLSNTLSKELRQIENASKTTATSVGGLGSSISSMINPARLLAGAGIAAGLAIFQMGKQALEAAAELHDLSQKTNFSVETLSALKNAGETSGASIASLSSALGIFDKNIVAAASGNKKLEATFAALKISTTDNEQALRDAFRALADMEGGANQTAAAMQLFGRSGKDVLSVIKETNGDLDAAIAKYKEMGTLISTETARDADELSDSLTELGQGAKAAALELVNGLAPALKVIIALAQVGITIIKGLGKVLHEIFAGDNFFAYYRNLQVMLDRVTEIANKMGLLARKPTEAGIRQAVPFGGLMIGMDLARTNARPNMEDLPEAGAGMTSTRRGTGTGTRSTAAANADRAAREREREAEREAKEEERIARDAAITMQRMAEEHQRSLTAIASVYRRARIVQLRDDAEEGKITFLQAEEAITTILEAELEKRRAAALKARDAEKEGTDEYRRLNDIYQEIQAEGAAAKEDAERRKRDALRQTIALEDIATTKAEMRARGGGEQADVPGGGFDLTGVIKEADYSEGKKKAPDFSEWKAAVADVKEMTVDSFKQMGQAMGSAIEAWVLYGSEGGQSIKKVMATILAALSAEAAVKAIFQLAEGFAKLAGWMPGPAALHFKAAALYGAVAVGAGVAGRALAGNSFSQGGAGAGGSSGSNGGGNAQQAKPTPVDVNRRAGETVIRVDIRRDSGSIVDAWVEDFQGNGRSRQVVSGDGQLATV